MTVTASIIRPQIKKIPYGFGRWTPICSIAASPTMLFVPNDSRFQPMDDVITAVNVEPDKYVFGSSGPSAITHLSLVSAFAGLDIMDKVKHLPFKGSGPEIKELTAGNIQFIGDTERLMKRGDFLPLILFNADRVEYFPDIPTAIKVGIDAPLNELYLWGGLFAPAALEPDVTAKLEAACDAAVASDGLQEFAKNSGTVINYRGAADFDAFYPAQYKANSALIKAAGL